MGYKRMKYAAAAALMVLSARPALAVSFTPLYAFAGGVDGAGPGNVAGHLSRIYGTTSQQGAFGWGNVWAYQVPTVSKSTVYNFTGGHDGGTPAGVVAVGALLYGATQAGGAALGAAGAGTLFALAPGEGALRTLYRFTGGADGGHPGAPVYANGALYGTLPASSAMQAGGIYRFDLQTHQETTLLRFAGGAGGSLPYGLISVGTALYGLAAGGDGVLFRIDLATGHEHVVYRFTGGPDGAAPAALTYAAGCLFGATNGAPAGTIFAYDLKSAQFTTLYRFRGARDGKAPSAVAYLGGFVYAAAQSGGGLGSEAGSLVRVNSVNGVETTLYDFSGLSDGAAPDHLTAFGGMIYGTTRAGGSPNNAGTLFMIANTGATPKRPPNR